MSHYPDRHHPVYFLLDALAALGVTAEFAKDDRTLGCWGMVFPEHENRVLVWLIDNRLPHERAKEDPAAKALLAQGAIVAHAQKPDMERVGGRWLPLAASPGFYPGNWTKSSDVAFVGYVRDEGRARLLSDVGAKFTLSLNQGVFGKQATEAYCGARVGLNVPSHYGTGVDYDINMRVFEIAACAAPLVTNDLPELVDLGFIDGKTCITYGAHRSIIDAVQYALDHREIGLAGRNLILDRHTYAHRAEQVQRWLSE
jgi:hypothetical protein